jgi:hypothetical protein
MNLLDPLTARCVNLARRQSLSDDRPSARLNRVAGSLTGLPAHTALRSLRLTHKALTAFSSSGDRHLGPCGGCGAPVLESDPFIRYHGVYYHAHACAESDPPALRRLYASRTSA